MKRTMPFLILFLLFSRFSFTNIEDSNALSGFENVNESKAPVLTKVNKRALAKDLSIFFGKKIRPKKVHVYNFYQLRQWDDVPSFMVKKIQKKKYKKFILVEFNSKTKLKQFILESTGKLKTHYLIDFIIAVNEEAQEQTFRRCTQRVCMPDGSCVTMEVITSGPCTDECGAGQGCLIPCLFTECDGGRCKTRMQHLPSCPDQFGACITDMDCADEGKNTTCIQKVCVQGGFCHTIYFEIEGDFTECPFDECEDDSDCGNDSGGLLDLLESEMEMI